MTRRVSSLYFGLLTLATACSDGQPDSSLDEPFPTYEFVAPDWPGSEEQARLLANEARDAEWAAPMEQLLTAGIEGLADFDFDGLRIECRTTVCGVASDFAVYDPLRDKYQETGAIREQILGAVKESTARIGIDGLRYDFSAAYDPDGSWTGSVGITVRRRAPRNVEQFLVPPRSQDEQV